MRALILLLCLAACSEGPVSGLNPHSGVFARGSAVATLDWRYPSRFEVRAVRLAKGETERFALLTFVTRSDLNYPKIESVWSHGTTLSYERIDRRRVGRRRQEAGTIALTRGAVRAAARGDGLHLQLIGLRGVYAGRVPAELFRDVLRR